MDLVDSSLSGSKIGKDGQSGMLNRGGQQIGFDGSYNAYNNSKLMKTTNSFFQQNASDKETLLKTQFSKMKNEMNIIDDKLYMTTKKNRGKEQSAIMEVTNEQKVLPPLKHKPKKFLPQMHGHFEKDNLLVNIGSLKSKNSGGVPAGPQSIHQHHSLNQKNKQTTH